MPSKTKAVASARKSTSVSQTLMNQRVVIWLLVGFVAFLTLWMLYTVKAMQAGSMTTSTEAFSVASKKTIGSECTRSDYSRTYNKGVKIRTLTKNGSTTITMVCVKVGTRFYWDAYTPNGDAYTP